jgi:hypothetical protein
MGLPNGGPGVVQPVYALGVAGAHCTFASPSSYNSVARPKSAVQPPGWTAHDPLSGEGSAIVILGHSGCGAISAAVDMFLRPELCLPLATKDDLRGMLDRSFVIIQASAHALQETLGPDIVARPGFRAALIETAVVMNAVVGAYTVQQGLSAQGETRFAVLYGVYVLEARQIWAPELDRFDWFHLAAPPSDLAGFHAISHAVAHCDRIASLPRSNRERQRGFASRRDPPRPINYSLSRIVPPHGVTIDPHKLPGCWTREPARVASGRLGAASVAATVRPLARCAIRSNEAM